MKRFYGIIFLIVLNILNAVNLCAETDQPPFTALDPGTHNSLGAIYRQMGDHKHIGTDGTQQIPPEATSIDNSIVSDFRGQIIFNAADFEWCGSTQTASATSWVKVHSPTTACGH